MILRRLGYTFFIFLLVIIGYSCKDSVTESNFSQQEINDFIPSHGASALPFAPNRMNRKNNTISSSVDTSTIHLIHNYLNSQDTFDYAAIAGVWNHDTKEYDYQLIPLTFPDSVLQKAQGEVGQYTYQLTNPDNGVIRKLTSIVPATQSAKTIMSNWLKVKDQQKVKQDSTGYNKNSDPIINNVEQPCEEGTVMGWCRIDFPDHTHFYECEVYVVCASPSGTGSTGNTGGDPGGSWPSSGGPGPNTGGGGPGTGGGPGGSDGNPPCGDPIHGCAGEDIGNNTSDTWETEIDMQDLDECMSDELTDLKLLQTGVGDIVQKFAGETPGYNWKVEDGDLPSFINARTNSSYENGTVTTTFDSQKFSSASDLSIAQNMLHEAVHAYLVAYFRVDGLEATKTYADLLRDMRNDKYPDQNTAQHAEFVRDFVDDIAIALKEFGNNRGYNLSDQYYNDLAWGGLTDWSKRDSDGNIIKDDNGNIRTEETDWFKSKFSDASDRQRVKKHIATEQGSQNVGDQKGGNGGC